MFVIVIVNAFRIVIAQFQNNKKSWRLFYVLKSQHIFFELTKQNNINKNNQTRKFGLFIIATGVYKHKQSHLHITKKLLEKTM